jgi:thiamine-monophosphate kinase
MTDRQSKTKSLGEFEIIARYFAPLATDPASLDLHDDAAVLRVPEGLEVIATCDTLTEGVHFLPGDPPSPIAHKALAASLSDLAAKGGRAYAYLLALSLPQAPTPKWLEGFANGLRALQDETGIALVGGDTSATPGPLSMTVTALGLVPQGHAVLRKGAKPGDRLYLTGTIGDAYLGRTLLQDPARAGAWGLSAEEAAFLVDRYRRPSPRCALSLLIRNFAQAAIDVSDGLVSDLEKLCHVSGVGARIESRRVPFSPPAAKVLEREPSLLASLITGGDDYEIVAAVPEASASAFEAEAEKGEIPVTAMGTVVLGKGDAAVLDLEGKAMTFECKGFSHF